MLYKLDFSLSDIADPPKSHSNFANPPPPPPNDFNRQTPKAELKVTAFE
jgi:hypothetical protein